MENSWRIGRCPEMGSTPPVAPRTATWASTAPETSKSKWRSSWSIAMLASELSWTW